MIVAGVDGSDAGLEAARWAAAEAALRGAALRLVHAMPAWALDDLGGPYADVARWMREGADAVLQAALEEVRSAEPAVSADAVRLPGDPRPALIKAAEAAELLVVGNHGLGGFRGLLLGSVALGVSGRAACPVVVVRALPARSGPDIVVGVDGAGSGTAAVEFAFAEAARRGADVVAVHAYSAGAGPDRAPGLPGAALGEAGSRHPGVKVIERSAPGHPVEVLLRESAGAALLVVGSRGTGDFTGLVLGSVSHALLHHARSPVAVVRP